VSSLKEKLGETQGGSEIGRAAPRGSSGDHRKKQEKKLLSPKGKVLEAELGVMVFGQHENPRRHRREFKGEAR